MKAIRVHRHGDPSVLQYEDMPDPVAGAGQVLVRIRAAGVNPVDTYIREGTQGYTAELPYTPGIDAAGEVCAAGDGVAGFNAQMRVYCSGTLTGAYAEYALCRPDQLHALPEALTFAQGASIAIPYTTAYRALFHRAGALPDRTLLVHGASGGVGLAAVQIARSAGMRVIATAGSDAGRSLVRRQGAEAVVGQRAPEVEVDHLLRVAVGLVRGIQERVGIDALGDAGREARLQEVFVGGRRGGRRRDPGRFEKVFLLVLLLDGRHVGVRAGWRQRRRDDQGRDDTA